MLVDSHCHLDMLDVSAYADGLKTVLDEARAEEVKHFLCVSVDLTKAANLIALAEQFPDVSASIGEHPTEHPSQTFSAAELKRLASHPRVVAIGETGLDYYRLEGDLSWQQERFRTHIRVAKELHKPLIVHTRLAKEDTLRILAEENAAAVGGVLHCFTEDLDMAERAIALNFYISFSGILTFKNAHQLHEIAAKLPRDRILVETDSPYLAPVPYRGKPNVPAYVRHTAAYLGELRGISLEEVAKQTTANFYNLFQLATQFS